MRAAAGLFRDAHASVATVPYDPMTRAGGTFAMLPAASPAVVGETIEQLGAEARQEADEIAEQGAAQARTLGLGEP